MGEPEKRVTPHPHSEIVTRMTGLLYPFILLYGLYIIVNGHLTPGGGFQGGAILATVFITRYLARPLFDIDIVTLQTLEKTFFLGIIVSPMLFLLRGVTGDSFTVLYLVLMNILIGFKVCCGLAILFFRFMFHEGEGKRHRGAISRWLI